jgi:hypothetical protein
MDGKAFRKGFY